MKPNRYSPEEMASIAWAATAMTDAGIRVCLPWEGDLDDREQEVFSAFVEAIRRYAGMTNIDH